MSLRSVLNLTVGLAVCLSASDMRDAIAKDNIRPASRDKVEELAGRWKPVSAVYSNSTLPRERLGPEIVILLVEEHPAEVCIEFQTEGTPSYMDAQVLYDEETKRNLMKLRSRIKFSETPPEVLYRIKDNRLVFVQDMGEKTFPHDFSSRAGDKKMIRIYERIEQRKPGEARRMGDQGRRSRKGS